MKKVLLVTYHFPPDATVGAIRPGKFAKYLADMDWEPIILTVKDKYYQAQDKSQRDGNYSRNKVIRTGMLRNFSYYYRKIKSVLRIDQGHSAGVQSSNPLKTKNGGIQLRQWISSLLSFPDEQAGWFPFALIMGMKVIRKKGIDILMTSGPPHSVHLIGACLSKLARIPWVADFRDPFLDDELLQQAAGKESISRKLARRLEAWFVLKATFILTTTQRYAQLLQSRYPLHKQKISTLPNGFDPEDFAGIQRGKERKFTISYLGSFYWRRDPEPLLRSVSELIHEKQIDPAKLVVRFIGHCNQVAGNPVNLLIKRYGLEGVVEIQPWLSKHEAFEIMVRSHVLLLLAEDQPLCVPGKVYEYLAAGCDILAITGDGATADLLRETGTGIVISPDDYPTVKATIKALYMKHLTYHQKDKKDFLGGNSFPMEYGRQHLTERLAMYLEKGSQAFSKN